MSDNWNTALKNWRTRPVDAVGDPWEHPDWSGDTVFILGGGPSLKGFDIERLRGRRIIAVNEAGLSLCPWADVLFWADLRWVQWNLERIALHRGALRYTCQRYRIADIPGARYIRHVPRLDKDTWNAFERDPTAVAGFDGGSRCINLAWHLKASRVVLLGFDMHDYDGERWREGNWHDAHPEPPLPNQRRGSFIPAHTRMAAALPKGFEVLNATPGSALKCWPMVNLEDVLNG